MSELIPLAAYNLNIQPYTPTPAIDVTVPVTVRITLAAIDPESIDDEKKPSTLRIIKRNPDFDDEDDILGGDFDEDELDSESSEEEEKEVEQKKSKKSGKKSKKEESKPEEEEEEEEDDDDEDDEDEEDDEFEEYVVLTLSPKTQFQQTLDLTITPEEEVQFVVTGSYPVHLTGNFVKHPFDQPTYSDDEDDSEDYDSDEYDLTPDEDEVLDDLDDLEDASDVEGRINELVQKEEDNKKKRKHEEKEPEQPKKQKKEEKQPKKEQKKEQKKEKKVEFKKDLEEGPSKKKEQKETPKAKSLEGGIVIEDRVVGTGKVAKRGAKVGMRYIGKLKNGKVFDKNTSGKPFVFNLGRGEVIKGWDIGVAGMAVGGERRIVIPAPYAYGKQALPGIPANSTLTFDVKLVSMK